MANNLTIKDRKKLELKADQVLNAAEAGLQIAAAGDHQGGAYRKPHLTPYDHDYIKELYQKRQNPKNPLDGDELPGGDVQLKLPLARRNNPLTIASASNPRMDILLPFDVKDDSLYSVPGGGSQGPRPTDKESEDLRRRNWSNLQINPDIADLLLPGETPAGGKGGLGSMNKDQLERWIKENGISGPAADKIRKKWGGLGPQLPINLAHNYRPGPTDGKLYNLLMIRANELRNQGKDKEAIDLMKIATPLHKIEGV